MVMLVDTNTLSRVFDENNAEHAEFRPVKEWFTSHGCFVFGGTKYKQELAKANYLRLFNLYKDRRKIISISDIEVNRLEKAIALKVDHNCDDQHLLAILVASNCSLVCSKDARAFHYFSKIRNYCTGAPSVKIYSRSKNKTLLPNPSETAKRKSKLNNVL